MKNSPFGGIVPDSFQEGGLADRFPKINISGRNSETGSSVTLAGQEAVVRRQEKIDRGIQF
jgi:hypothetical protein